MSFFSVAEQLAALDRSAVVLDTKRCLRSEDQFSVCEACFDICPVNAIIPGRPPSLDSKKCERCLACLTVCSVGAFHADDTVASLLNCAARVKSSPVELICSRHPHPETGAVEGLGIRVKGCLSGLGVGAYLMLASMGLEKIVVRTDACKECAWAGLQKRVEKQVSQARLFLAAWDKADSIVCKLNDEKITRRPVWDSENPPLTRRDMFRMLAQQGKVAIAHSMENGQTSNSGEPGRDRLRLLLAVKRMPMAETDTKLPLGPLSFAFITISDACDACGVCGRACPTGALQFEKKENEIFYALEFNGLNCIGCDVCAHVCASSALSIDHNPRYLQIFGKDTITLREGELMRCQSCHALIVKREGNGLCSLCEYRRENPFGSALPPGARFQLQAKNKKLS